MSGIIGHTAYAILAAKAAESRKLPVAPLIRNHFSSYLAGAYLGCDVQTVPAAVCVDTGESLGYGSQKMERSPVTGGVVTSWFLPIGDRKVFPREIHETFYGRSHLILGWAKEARDETISWGEYLDFAADVAGDAVELFGPGHRALAYTLGWMTHVSGDGLIKSVLDGINLNLLDGTYTAKNRPVQDLVTFNEIGKKELDLNWSVILDDLATTPVEDVQLHYMRCYPRQGRLGAHFPKGWAPDQEGLLRAVLAENRRYQRIRNSRIISQLTLKPGPNGVLQCDEELSKIAGGLNYREMLEAAEKANFRHALWQIGELIADAFEKVIERQDILHDFPTTDGPTWEELGKRFWSP
ncbi:hypothetical protein N9E25_14595 [Verrucomicrobiales bacterium]|jgi:hypothetical protein|nr:hypothetical protein [Verrucomicrobiales bacterium]